MAASAFPIVTDLGLPRSANGMESVAVVDRQLEQRKGIPVP